MHGKLIWTLIGSILANCAMMITIAHITVEAVLQFRAETVTHPWSYYILFGCLAFSFNRIHRIFDRGADEQRKALAEPQD